MFLSFDRNVKSLKRKFAALRSRKMLKGDPLMPEDVQRAKNIRYKMTDRADTVVVDKCNKN